MKTKKASVNSNDRTHDITPEEVRRFERFKSYTDEQISELILLPIESVRHYFNLKDFRSFCDTPLLM